MDRPRRRSAAAVACFAASLAAGLALAADAPAPIRALNWVAPGADLTRAIATQPTECLAKSRDPATARKVEIGRAAFRTPVLLGGQAARAGLACETCHRDGRDNPDFHFPGISGAPGTADVTQSLFSTHRGDGIDNPKPIPDLSGPKAKLKIDQAPQGRALESFIHGLVVEEFDGPEPSPAVLEGLAAYVRALNAAACPRATREPVNVRRLMDDARRAVLAARDAQSRGDRATAVLMLASARTRLGLIDERFAGAERIVALRAALIAASARLGQTQAALRDADAAADPAALDRWLADSRQLEGDLAAAEPGSLFDAKRLQSAMTRRLPA